MTETPKKTQFTIVAKLFRWIFIVIGSGATFFAGEFLVRRFTLHMGVADKGPYILVNLIAIAFCLWLLSPIIRLIFPPLFRPTKRFYNWFFTWQTMRHLLIAMAVLATLVAIFYTEEDWRGKHDWEKCKTQLEAQGAVLDWDKFIPAPVPDDQNFYTYSTNFFKFRQLSGTNDPEYKSVLASTWLRNLDPINPSNGVSSWYDSKRRPFVVAQIIVSPQFDDSLLHGTNTLLVSLNDTNAPGRVQELIQAAMGQTIQGAQGFEFSRFQPGDFQPAKIFLQTAIPVHHYDLQRLIPPDTQLQTVDTPLQVAESRFQADMPVGQKTFNVVPTRIPGITAASDYLKWSDQFVPAFDEIREALKRPYAILPGDYSVPYAMPIPNFVIMRVLAQTLGQRAQCYLLLGQPDKALHELTLIHDVCRILEKPPTGKPETLVEAMINVAIHGLYVQIISEGMQRHAWQEPQLAALQEQLARINLPSPVTRAFETERADICRNLQDEGLGVLFAEYDRFDVAYPWGKLKNLELHSVANFGPRGWVYQNMAAIATLSTEQCQVFNLANDTIQPEKLNDIRHRMDAMARPYTFYLLIGQFLPDFTKAWQTTAYNQTQVNEAQIACALERYYLAHGEYPETLDALSPRFMETFPNDIIGGEPLIYRRTDDGKFLLYSIGWNETDDGGQQSPHGAQGYGIDFAKGDWVWPN